MSRAREASTVYVVADDRDQAREDLTRDWATRRTPTWAIDTAQPAGDARGVRGRVVAVAHARARLLVTATHPGRPPARPRQAEETRTALDRARQQLADLASLTGVYTAGPVGDAARHARQAGSRLGQLEHAAATGSWRERHNARHDLPAASEAAAAADDRLDRLVAVEQGRLDQEITLLQPALADLDTQAGVAGQRWQQAAGEHASASRGQQRLGRILDTTRRRLEQPDRPTRHPPDAPIAVKRLVAGSGLGATAGSGWRARCCA